MNIRFSKYEGTGNDFILIDNRSKDISLNTAQVAFLCDRHFGIGADGLMLLEPEEGYDFRMVYYNSDGNESTMCGNGGRCIAAFAQKLGVVQGKARFVAIDGPHTVTCEGDIIHLQMQDITGVEHHNGYSVLNTGSPHYVQWVRSVAEVDVFHEGRRIRNLEAFQPKGINVNFVEQLPGDGIAVRTYERGVEDETLSCGTGVTAAAMVSTGGLSGKQKVPVRTPGGMLSVSLEKDSADTAKNVILSGPATFVFEGEIEIKGGN